MHRTGNCLSQQTPGIKRIPSSTCNPACSLPRRRHLHLLTQSCKPPQTGLYQHMACRSCNRRSRQTPAIVRAYGSEGGTDAQTSSISAQTTGSTLIQRELVLFIIQQDYDKQLQRALNYEDFDLATELRQRREQLTEAVADFQASKGPGDGAREARQADVADFASEGLRLRSEMQRAAEEERYADASALRDQLKQLQQEADAAAATAAGQQVSCKRQFSLGQRVVHANLGYRGIVCGCSQQFHISVWDVRCCEDEDWQTENCVHSLDRGSAQPFYHVLVDLRDWDDGNPQTAITYVPEELLMPPASSETWSEQHGDDSAFIHPFAGMLFLGNDHAGDFLPSKPLREKYSAARRDVGPPDGGGDDGEDDSPEDADSSTGPFDGPSGSSDDGPTGLDFGGPGGFTIM